MAGEPVKFGSIACRGSHPAATGCVSFHMVTYLYLLAPETQGPVKLQWFQMYMLLLTQRSPYKGTGLFSIFMYSTNSIVYQEEFTA